MNTCPFCPHLVSCELKEKRRWVAIPRHTPKIHIPSKDDAEVLAITKIRRADERAKNAKRASSSCIMHHRHHHRLPPINKSHNTSPYPPIPPQSGPRSVSSYVVGTRFLQLLPSSTCSPSSPPQTRRPHPQSSTPNTPCTRARRFLARPVPLGRVRRIGRRSVRQGAVSSRICSRRG